MKIRDWEGIALIIGSGDIGNHVSDYLTNIAPRLDVIICGRNLNSNNGIYLDLESDESFNYFEKKLSLFNKPFRLVINTSGFLHSNQIKPEKRLSHVNRLNINKNFSINAIAPILIAKSIENYLRPELPFSFSSLSARVGSIGDNNLGGWYSYRASKAAQNQFLKTLSIEWRRKFPNAVVTILHPGTCDTKLSKPFQSSVLKDRLFTPAKASEYLINIISEQKPTDSGKFIAWDNSVIPW
ncbi:short-chain dehydrogenase [Prochlorococcus marinus]|uniref:Short-chain dehydrogenase n=1 Tax=Prochlorococcus marinus XMU1408 TaxID=2213228 RepID=A0A318RBF3_PROMR|nr:short-chain dehydrogenase [Prochlorococcus marinus]MBW3042028.1 short-chain dehydrogenase [Prochlorococcus marinus str. XMU1408]PYE03149.1 short-chain dehydrogenase [Prochlorococcus marinus XMU1408]